MKVKLQIIILIFIGICTSVLAEDVVVDTNLDIFKNLYYKGFSNAFQKVAVLDSLPLYFNNINKNKTIDWLIEEQFVKSAERAGFSTLILLGDSTILKNEKNFYVEYRSVINNVHYSAMSVLPENKQNRKVNIEFYIKILDPDNRILLSTVINESYSDTINVNNINHIENKNLPFTVGERSKSLVSELLEPLLVTLITGSIIYIFYSFRSN
ncbi:hypothetical protein JXQ31_04270 [candidate division KSB1 bacterium]|nr:hypothetical protein [candidate division KSB1 bacterium]